MKVHQPVFLIYVIPYALTFLMFYILYKYIPEVKVHTRAGLIPAAVAAFLFELFKRAFAFYVVHFSAVGVVLNKLLQGTLTSVLFFLLLMSSSMLILLWGAEFAAVLNEKYDAAAAQMPATKTA